MSMIIVSKGFSLPYLGIAIASMSISVILLEVPSGLFCDAKGRRMSFLIGMVFTTIGTLFLFPSSFLLLCIGFALNGVGRAFSSGSLDALIIEDTDEVSHAIFALELSSSFSLAVGALCGGFLLNMGSSGDKQTNYVLIVRLVLVVHTIILTPLLVKNDKKEIKSILLKEQLALVRRELKENRPIRAYMVGVITLGVLLSTTETYWQPYLKELLVDDSKLWILGVVASSIFLMSMLGSFLGKLLLRSFQPQTLYRFLFLSDLSLLALLSRTTTVAMFLTLFLLLYLVLGALSMSGGTFLHTRVENSMRSSMLSLSSFALQVGGVLSSLFSALLLTFLPLSGFWVCVSIGGAITILVAFRVPKGGDCPTV